MLQVDCGACDFFFSSFPLQSEILLFPFKCTVYIQILVPVLDIFNFNLEWS